MKILLDTNILISAFIFGGSVKNLLNILLGTEYVLYISEYVDNEFRYILNGKWPHKYVDTCKKYESMRFNFCSSSQEILPLLRDPKDNPVLSDALFHKVDVLLTGDKDFLESGITNPMILSPTQMVEFLQANKQIGGNGLL